MTHPLLTIAIPTWNRAVYLDASLRQLQSELQSIEPTLVEIIVSDNCSPDNTPDVVRDAIGRGLPIRYIRNADNLGWAPNFAQAFEMSAGKYVLMMGDDDLFVDGGLALLLDRLRGHDYGVVCLKPYGFDEDFRQEFPGGGGRDRVFTDSNRFLVAISRFFTLTSSNVVNKSLLGGVETRQFLDTDLAVFHLVLRAALAARSNLYVDQYLVASKRQNSFSYEYANVFVRQMWRIIDAHVEWGLRPGTIRRLERDKLLSYYPFYLFDLRMSRRGNLDLTRELLDARFSQRALYRWWLLPIIQLPRPLALAWGAAAVVIGRVADGQLRRGIRFAASRVRRKLSGNRAAGAAGA